MWCDLFILAENGNGHAHLIYTKVRRHRRRRRHHRSSVVTKENKTMHCLYLVGGRSEMDDTRIQISGIRYQVNPCD